jgi:hypothetical protein
MLMISAMKGYLTLGLGLLAFCTAILVSGCSEDSGWGAGYGGIPLQQNGTRSVTSGTAPDGSGAVDYIPSGNF